MRKSYLKWALLLARAAPTLLRRAWGLRGQRIGDAANPGPSAARLRAPAGLRPSKRPKLDLRLHRGHKDLTVKKRQDYLADLERWSLAVLQTPLASVLQLSPELAGEVLARYGQWC